MENSIAFSEFFMVTHLFLFIHDIRYAYIHKKNVRCSQKPMLRQQKKLFHIEVTLRPKLCESRKNMLWQQNKLCDTQKRDSC